MIAHKIHGTLIFLTISLVPLSSTQAACCSWWNSWFGRPTTTVGYAPFVASYAPAGCGQTVNYVPQTCFRTVFVNTPVASCAPVMACNACGGATTVMRPVTTFVTQARLVPYTTFRPVVTTAFAPVVMPTTAFAVPAGRACCGANFAPAVSSYMPAPAAGACCGGSTYAAGYAANYAPPPITAQPLLSAPPLTAAPGTTLQTLAPAPTSSAPSSASPPGFSPSIPSASPSLAPPSGGTSPSEAPSNKTFEESAKPAVEPQSRIILPPRSEPSNSNTSGRRRALDPEEGMGEDRTTSLPVRPAYTVRTASMVTPLGAVRPAAPKLDDGGWSAGRNRD